MNKSKKYIVRAKDAGVFYGNIDYRAYEALNNKLSKKLDV